MQDHRILPGNVRIGAKFGSLKVLSFSHMGKRYMAYIKCLCKCGKEYTTRAASLRNGHAKSCGCNLKRKMANVLSGIKLPRLPRIDGVAFKYFTRAPGYAISDDGRFWSCRTRREDVTFLDSWTERKVHFIQGYPAISVTINGVQKEFLLHRLVLETFVGPCPPGMEARHFPDRDHLNCRLSNLSWATRKVNQSDRIIHGTTARGERSYNAKLTEADAIQIIQRVAKGESHPSIQKDFPVAQSTISRIATGKRWPHLQSYRL